MSIDAVAAARICQDACSHSIEGDALEMKKAVVARIAVMTPAISHGMRAGTRPHTPHVMLTITTMTVAGRNPYIQAARVST